MLMLEDFDSYTKKINKKGSMLGREQVIQISDNNCVIYNLQS